VAIGIKTQNKYAILCFGINGISVMKYLVHIDQVNHKRFFKSVVK